MDLETVETATAKKRVRFLKVAVLGEKGVGKTSLRCRWARDDFPEDTSFMASFDVVHLEACGDEPGADMQVWEQAAEGPDPLGQAFFMGVDLFVFIFDVTRKRTLESLAGFIDEAEAYNNTCAAKVLLGNKADLAGDREVSQEDATSWGSAHGLSLYFEVSARTGEPTCQEMFSSALQQQQMPESDPPAAFAAEGVTPSQSCYQGCCERCLQCIWTLLLVLLGPFMLLLLLAFCLPALLVYPVVRLLENHCKLCVRGNSQPELLSEACNRSGQGKCESERGAGRLWNFGDRKSVV